MTSRAVQNADIDVAAIVQRLWGFCNILKDDGVSYSDYLEQLIYLLFLKMEDEAVIEGGRRTSLPAKCRWPDLLHRDGLDLETQYMATLQRLARIPGSIGRIFHRAQNRIQDAAKLRRLIGLINAERWSAMDADVKGAIYEGLLERNAEDVKSGAGQYFTPRALLRSIVTVMDPEPGESICDPACGTGGFLLAAERWIRERRQRQGARRTGQASYAGWEIVPATGRLCLMNMHLRGIPEKAVDIRIADALLSLPDYRYDLILTNPPFGRRSSMTFTNEVRDNVEDLVYQRPDFVATTSNKQLNFLQHVMSLLDRHGRAAIVVSDNILFDAGAGEVVRRHLLTKFNVHTLLRLPTGIFYANSVKASVIFMERLTNGKSGTKGQLWTYDLRTGNRFSLRSRPLDDAALADFVQRYGGPRRQGRRESERFRPHRVSDILSSQRCSLNVGLLAARSDAVQLDPPGIIAGELLDQLEAALDAIRLVEEQLGR